MNKKEIIMQTAARAAVTKKDAVRVVDAFLSVIGDVLEQGGEASIPDFGKFKTRFVAEHTARNPQTGESVLVPDKNVVVFKPFANITYYSQKM